MKEYSFDLSEVFKEGIRPFHQRSRGLQLYDLFNLKPTNSGMVGFDEVVFPISWSSISSYGLDSEEFPFPQLIIGKKYNFICCSDRIFIIDPNDWDVLAELDTYDPDTPANEKDITSGGYWSLADFWDTWFLTNGVCTVFACGEGWIESNKQKVYVSDATPIKAAQDYKGRLVLAGFNPNNFWSDTAETFLANWYDKNYDTGFNPYQERDNTDKLAPINNNFFWWSSIGGGDALLFFLPSKVLNDSFISSSSFDSDDPFYLEILKRNEQGFAPLPVQGQITDIELIGESLLMLSEDGVGFVQAVSQPTPTMGIRNLNLGGIACRGASASNLKTAVYIDNSGLLIEINADGSVQPVGYREFFAPLIGTDIIISHSHNPSLDRDNFGKFYISNGEKTFIYSKKGLIEVGQKVTSVGYARGATVGLGTEIFDTEDLIGRIGIDGQDFQMPGRKTLEWVQVEFDEISEDATPLTSLSVSIDYQYTNTNDESWYSTDYEYVNSEGFIYNPVCANKFRINIKVDDYEKFSIIYATVGIKYGDRRYKRSLSVSTLE